MIRYFKAPNKVFELNLSSSEKLVLFYLLRCGNNGKPAIPSYETIGKNCSISRRSAIRAVSKLKSINLVNYTRTKKSNIYRIAGVTVSPR